MEAFTDAVRKYRDFLLSAGYATTLLWVFQEDILTAPGKVWLRWPLPLENAEYAAREYERGRHQGFGVALEMLCVAEGLPCCYLNIPVDAQEASYQMIAGLKFSIPSELPQIKVVRHHWQWKVLSYLIRKRCWWLAGIPVRGG